MTDPFETRAMDRASDKREDRTAATGKLIKIPKDMGSGFFKGCIFILILESISLVWILLASLHDWLPAWIGVGAIAMLIVWKWPEKK